MTLTAIYLGESADPEIDIPIISFRSDRPGRTVGQEELTELTRRYRPIWNFRPHDGEILDLTVFWAEIDLDAPVVCCVCHQTVPIEVVDENFRCASCQNLPADALQRMIGGI